MQSCHVQHRKENFQVDKINKRTYSSIMNKQISFTNMYVRTPAKALCWAQERSTGSDLGNIPGSQGFCK